MVDGWIWFLIVSVPDLCILFTFMLFTSKDREKKIFSDDITFSTQDF